MSGSDDKFYCAKITKRTDIAPDLWRICLNPGGSTSAQDSYARLGLQGPNKRIEQAYFIFSSPYEEELEFVGLSKVQPTPEAEGKRLD